MVELEHDDVGLSAVHARVSLEMGDDAEEVAMAVPSLKLVEAGAIHAHDIRTYVRHCGSWSGGLPEGRDPA
ncbi:hypothetical protein GCM10022202_03220 [Microbacterium marinilacus]|uniref:Uncharacterized protein n=1 Tax=Microbacterium marinilacus TaxID=415209 RepID=A0ABP7B4G2_9MICO